jgi:hypothetical protein
MYISLLNSTCYTLGWFWCVYCGIYVHPFLAFSGGILLIVLQLFITKLFEPNLYSSDLVLALSATLLGILLEMVFISIGIVHYAGAYSIFPPIWIIPLYPLFALVINHSLKLIKKSYLLAFLLGFAGAPLSYIAGQKLGGLTFGYSDPTIWMMIGICWGVILCLLAKIGRMTTLL